MDVNETHLDGLGIRLRNGILGGVPHSKSVHMAKCRDGRNCIVFHGAMLKEKMKILRTVYDDLCNTVGTFPPESGAMLGWDGECIVKIWFDEPAGSGKPLYRPSCNEVESAVNEWLRDGLQFAGVAHSHTDEYPTLSPMDLRSAMMIMEANRMESILMGLFCNGKLRMFELREVPNGEHPELIPLEIEII